MRKADLTVGDEYAAGSTSRHDRWKLARVRLVELDGLRPVRNSHGNFSERRGVVVVLVEDHERYPLRGKAGDELVLPSARDIIEPWSPYAERKAENDRKIEAVRAERQRQREVAEDVTMRLKLLGVDVRYVNGAFTISADVMAQIVAMIPSEGGGTS